MGAVTAFYGIRGAMTILHGSQGCATYIRRHMATHYNEPVDVASSSLTEQGTVFGGEANLLKGLSNLIALYRPEVIGVCTTCLAETIGEDVPAITRRFLEAHPDCEAKIITVASPGYGGTQNEGFFASLRAIAEQTVVPSPPNGKVNIITPQLSPADTRFLKSFLAESGLDCILLPDLSENLDGATEKRYQRLKSGGTPIEEIGKMAGARMTLEFSEFPRDGQSPGAFLRDKFGVPLTHLPLPVGLRGTDALADAIASLGGAVPAEHKKARGRYLDAMVDGHKYTSKARAAVFGDPDFVLAVTRLCCENGVLPAVTATGSVSPALRDALRSEISDCAEYLFADETVILDDCDFSEIERACSDMGVNVMLGSGDARRAAARLGIPLIRCAFPIHDRVGGQRVRTLGFGGSLSLLDQTANAMLELTEHGYRGEMYGRFYLADEDDDARSDAPENTSAPAATKSAAARTDSHPCFGENACENARVHLPVAPACNIQCNYCVRGYDCANESRPGVTKGILTPGEALIRYQKLKESVPNLTVAGIAGPGDALANFAETRETLRLIRGYDADVTFCVSTNGLMLPQYAAELIALGVSHVTVTVNAVDPEIGAKVYKYVDYMGTRYDGAAGAAILLANQLAGIRILADAGVVVKVNCVALKGVNDAHIPYITKTAAKLGAYMTNIMPHIPVESSAFGSLDRLTAAEIDALRDECGADIRQMRHCRQCRADAAGRIGHDVTAADAVPEPESATSERLYAVATRGGTLVDTHLGKADAFYIYSSDGAKTRYVETRKVSRYCSGECGETEDKWTVLLRAVGDCDAVISSQAGESPSRRLGECGIRVINSREKVETAVAKAASELLIKF
jgi:nitrogenase molybdenum-iron protein alpha/beta subunit/MoaA/NifB/PqqE/SkfB family radical SAM enzyme/predicted Fe-Mo cluster-binding NifX family protein